MIPSAAPSTSNYARDTINADRIVDGAMHDCDECQNLPRVYD